MTSMTAKSSAALTDGAAIMGLLTAISPASF
jgi:hypothetical protein